MKERAVSPSSPSAPHGGWQRDGDHALVHPGGWSIARYRIDGVWTHMLWHGNETQGRFATPDAAKSRHAELTGATVSGATQERMA
ncbi:hypothetical protein VOI32_41025 [Paraburkholderia caribensis]|uniref:Uncharacterized protein n=2 Tax=Paraburkholderia TaxID=1822464 RepID=B2JXV3_PARP8|nr:MULTISPECIES: hypothetical protein [Paraburkholderia]ACC76461.1 hypothetical protein Bphy_7525 [Paraburkholderia phymatum STM815]MCO4879370.1 hypothetical protein [Paraburkholderia caribensis]PTB23055.1 hypothetical protein C9I56_41230 [Paraburkholderia caribensis]